jgi:hypothetical protein
MKKKATERPSSYRTTDAERVQPKVDANRFGVGFRRRDAGRVFHATRDGLRRLFGRRQVKIDGHPLAIAAARLDLAVVGFDHLFYERQAEADIVLRMFVRVAVVKKGGDCLGR